LKYDSAQGRFEQDIKSTENSIIVNGKEVKIYAEKSPAAIPWKQHDVDVVLECTGFSRTRIRLLPIDRRRKKSGYFGSGYRRTENHRFQCQP